MPFPRGPGLKRGPHRMTSMTRRAFIWRSALMGGGAALATSLLAACGAQPTPPTSSGGAAPAAAPAATTAAQPAAAGAVGGTLNIGLGRVLQDLNGFDLDIASYTNQA